MGVSPASVWEAGARNEMEEDVAVTRAVCNRAGNEPSRTMPLLALSQLRHYAQISKAMGTSVSIDS